MKHWRLLDTTRVPEALLPEVFHSRAEAEDSARVWAEQKLRRFVIMEAVHVVESGAVIAVTSTELK